MSVAVWIKGVSAVRGLCWSCDFQLQPLTEHDAPMAGEHGLQMRRDARACVVRETVLRLDYQHIAKLEAQGLETADLFEFQRDVDSRCFGHAWKGGRTPRLECTNRGMTMSRCCGEVQDAAR